MSDEFTNNTDDKSVTIEVVESTEDVIAEKATEGAASAETEAVSYEEKEPTKQVSSLKKFLNVKILLRVAAAAVILLVAFNAAEVANAAVKFFSSPKSYFEHVVGKASDKAVSKTAQSYGEMLSTLTRTESVGSSTEMGITFGEDVRGILSEDVALDLSWLEKLALLVDVDATEDATKTNMALAVNEDKLVSFQLLLDMAENYGYLQVPELNPDWLGMEMDDFLELCDVDMDTDEIKAATEESEKLYKALPSQAEVERVLKRYSNLMISCIEDVEQESETVTVGDVSQKFTVLEVSVDEETVQRMLEKAVKKLREDKDVKKIMLDILTVVEEQDETEELDADEVYEDFLDALDEMEDAIDDLDEADFEAVVKVYVDKKGDICGTVVTVEEEAVEVSCLMTKKGHQYAYEFEADVNGVKASLNGNGKMTDSKMNGEFEVRAAGMKLVDIQLADVRLRELQKGYFNGTVSVSLAKNVAGLLEKSVPEFPFEIKDLVLNYVVSTGKNHSDVTISLLEEENLLGSVFVKSETGKPKKIVPPSDAMPVEDAEDLERWVDDMDIDAFLENLEGKISDELFTLLKVYVFGYPKEDGLTNLEDWY